MPHYPLTLALANPTPRLRSLAAITILLVAAACSNNGDGEAAPPPTADPVILNRGVYTSAGDSRSWPYELLRLANTDGGYTYAQWFPPATGAVTPIILAVEPYAGIDWTGEALDRRWALQGNGCCFADVDAPEYQAGGSGTIGYEQFTPERVGVNSEMYLRNGFGVLTVFGRFYAGGSVWNDVQDTVAGLRFLGTQSNVDRARVGIFGTSWGGFEAVYGAAYAPAEVVPLVGAAVAPLIDFERFVNFLDTTLPTVTSATTLPRYNAFYDPYLRRLFATTRGRPGDADADYSRLRSAALGPRLNTRLLIAHDSADTILPVAVSTQFVTANPTRTQGFWYKQSDPIDYNANVLTHGAIGAASAYPPVYSFSLAYLFTALANDRQSVLAVPYGNADFDVFFQNIRTDQMNGLAVAWVVPRLLELCDARVYLYDVSAGTNIPVMSGATVLASKMSAAWSTAFTDVSICSQLAANGLPR